MIFKQLNINSKIYINFFAQINFLFLQAIFIKTSANVSFIQSIFSNLILFFSFKDLNCQDLFSKNLCRLILYSNKCEDSYFGHAKCCHTCKKEISNDFTKLKTI